jgi:hypothetical protein
MYMMMKGFSFLSSFPVAFPSLPLLHILLSTCLRERKRGKREVLTHLINIRANRGRRSTLRPNGHLVGGGVLNQVQHRHREVLEVRKQGRKELAVFFVVHLRTPEGF